MNRAKSMFVTPYFGLSLVITVFAGVRIFYGEVAWGFVFLMTVPLLVPTVANSFLRWFSTTKRYLPIPSALFLVGLVGAVSSLFWWKFDAFLALSVAVLTVGYSLYLFWYSSYSPNGAPRIVRGKPLPQWSAVDLNGQAVSGDDLLGKPALVVFYRGNWCPFCVVQVQKVAENYRKLDERGFRVVLVSPQSANHTQELAQKFEVPMTFWVDEGNRAAEALGIADRQGLPLGLESMGYESDTVQATSILLDEKGTVFYCDLTDSYRVRPTPEDYLAEIDRWKARSAA